MVRRVTADRRLHRIGNGLPGDLADLVTRRRLTARRAMGLANQWRRAGTALLLNQPEPLPPDKLIWSASVIDTPALSVARHTIHAARPASVCPAAPGLR